MTFDYAAALRKAEKNNDAEAAAYFRSKLQPSAARDQEQLEMGRYLVEREVAREEEEKARNGMSPPARYRPAPSGAPAPAPVVQGSGAPVAAAPEGSTAPQDSPSAARWGGGKAGRFMAGLGDSGIKTWLGLKQLAVGLDDTEKGILKAMEEDTAQDQSGWRTGGRVVGDIAQTAIPAAKVTKALQATRLVSAIPKTASVAVPALTSGAQEFLTAPTEGEGRDLEGRAANAMKAAAVGGALAGGGKVLAKTLTGAFKPSAEAQALLNEGIVPKLQEGAESTAGKWIGRLTKGSIDPYNERENKEVIQAISRRLLPNEDTSKYTPAELVSALKAGMDRGYDAILGNKTFTMSSQDTASILSAVRTAASGRREILAEANAAIASVLPKTKNTLVLRYNPTDPSKGLSYKREQFEDLISEYATSDNAKDKAVAKVLRAAKDRFDETVRDSRLSADELTALKEHDQAYKAFTRIKEAANSPRGQRDISPTDVVGASKKLAPGKDISTGTYPNSDLLGPANRLFNKGGEEGRRLMVAMNRAASLGKGVALGGGATLATSGPIAAAVLGPAYATSLLGQTRAGARALYGDYDLQKVLAEKLRGAAPYLSGAGALPEYNGEQ